MRRHVIACGAWAAAFAVGGLAGCASDPRVSEHELAVGRLERRVDELAGLLGRVTALEALATAAPAPGTDPAVRLAALEARLEALEADVVRLARGAQPPPPSPRPVDLVPTPGGPPGPGGPGAGTDLQGTDLALGTGDRPGVVLSGTGAGPGGSSRDPAVVPGGPQDPSGAGFGPPPAAGAPVELLSVGTAALVLVRSGGRLERVELLGVEAPEPLGVYADRAELRARHAAALGEAAVRGNAAFERSRAYLEALLGGRTVTLAYPRGAEPRGPNGGLRAYVTAQGPDGPIDVNAAVLRDGFGLASGEHERGDAYQALEREARAAARGLFAR